MQEKPLNLISKKVCRVYLVLDKPFNMSIMEYKWSSTEPEWVIEKMIWNTYGETTLKNSLRDGKYTVTIL